VSGNPAFVAVCTGRAEALHVPAVQGAFFSGMRAGVGCREEEVIRG